MDSGGLPYNVQISEQDEGERVYAIHIHISKLSYKTPQPEEYFRIIKIGFEDFWSDGLIRHQSTYRKELLYPQYSFDA